MITFETGKTYQTRSICDYDCVFSYEVVSRTAKQLTLKVDGNKIVKRGIFVRDGVEHCKPEGTYSMCPVIRADRQLI